MPRLTDIFVLIFSSFLRELISQLHLMAPGTFIYKMFRKIVLLLIYMPVKYLNLPFLVFGIFHHKFMRQNFTNLNPFIVLGRQNLLEKVNSSGVWVERSHQLYFFVVFNRFRLRLFVGFDERDLLIKRHSEILNLLSSVKNYQFLKRKIFKFRVLPLSQPHVCNFDIFVFIKHDIINSKLSLVNNIFVLQVIDDPIDLVNNFSYLDLIQIRNSFSQGATF